MKKRYIMLTVILCILLIWIGSIIASGIFTLCFGSEFMDFEALDIGYLYNYGKNTKISVLYYFQSRSVVYFYSDLGGEKVLLIKSEGKWKVEETLASWSSQGSADDYFIWPYFKNYVPGFCSTEAGDRGTVLLSPC